MIDEEATFDKFGYTSSSLKQQSHKLIIAICDGCGRVKEMMYYAYRRWCHSCAVMGDRNPMFGRHHSLSARQMIGDMERGEKNHNYGMCGAASFGWKGGMEKWRYRIIKTQSYKNWRKCVFERDGYRCVLCGDKKGGNLQAHHIVPVRICKDDLRVFDVDNGATVCEQCHDKIGKREHIYEKLFIVLIGGGDAYKSICM